MTLTALHFALLVLGGVLVLGALLAGQIAAGAAKSATGTGVRVFLGLAGIIALACGLAPLWRPASIPAPASATASATPPPPAAPATTSAAAPSPAEMVEAASTALNDCPLASAPPVPDGGQASLAQMDEARRAFQAYDTATNAYTHCVDTAVDRVVSRYAAVASPSGLQNLKAFGVRAHNTAIDQEQAMAEQLNAQVHAYNAKHPPRHDAPR